MRCHQTDSWTILQDHLSSLPHLILTTYSTNRQNHLANMCPFKTTLYQPHLFWVCISHDMLWLTTIHPGPHRQRFLICSDIIECRLADGTLSWQMVWSRWSITSKQGKHKIEAAFVKRSHGKTWSWKGLVSKRKWTQCDYCMRQNLSILRFFWPAYQGSELSASETNLDAEKRSRGICLRWWWRNKASDL